ncbi:MAG: Gfo/Idh/MocA family oxidoreductase [Clostridia bacterium]|nr:Gfo/Idh/MocA family oxidoreductase [Clostridia bacterium]
MEKVKFGVIGLGRIAHEFCNDLLRSDKAMLYAVASNSEDRGKEFAEKYGAKKVYSSYEELAKDSDVEIIYIATPHVFHKENAILCMENGKSVLCEKPAGINKQELTEMINCAKKNDVFFMEGMWTRFFPISSQIKKIAETGELGKVRHIEADFGFGSWEDAEAEGRSARHFEPNLAGGAILDLGVYSVAFASWLKGKSPDRIAAFADMTKTGVDGNTVCAFQYDDRTTALLQCSICVNTSIQARIYFERGRAEINTFIKPDLMKIIYADGKEEIITDEYASKGLRGFIYEIDHVSECIRNGLKMSPIHSWDESMEIIKTLDEIRSQVGLKYPFE